MNLTRTLVCAVVSVRSLPVNLSQLDILVGGFILESPSKLSYLAHMSVRMERNKKTEEREQ